MKVEYGDYWRYGRRRVCLAKPVSRFAPVYPISRKIPVDENGISESVKNIPVPYGAVIRYPSFLAFKDPVNPEKPSTSMRESKRKSLWGRISVLSVSLVKSVISGSTVHERRYIPIHGAHASKINTIFACLVEEKSFPLRISLCAFIHAWPKVSWLRSTYARFI